MFGRDPLDVVFVIMAAFVTLASAVFLYDRVANTVPSVCEAARFTAFIAALQAASRGGVGGGAAVTSSVWDLIVAGGAVALGVYIVFVFLATLLTFAAAAIAVGVRTAIVRYRVWRMDRRLNRLFKRGR